MRTNQREAGFVFQNGRLALTFKSGINDRQLPAGRRLCRPNRMRAAEEVDVLDHIAAFVNARQRRAEMKIHVREKTVLGIARPHHDRAGISVLNLEINIGERGIKRSGIGIGNGTGISLWVTRSCAGEKNHEFFVRRIAKARRGGGQNNHRPFGTVANQPDAGPNINGIAHVILSRRKHDDALAGGILNPVDRLLQCCVSSPPPEGVT